MATNDNKDFEQLRKDLEAEKEKVQALQEALEALTAQIGQLKSLLPVIPVVRPIEHFTNDGDHVIDQEANPLGYGLDFFNEMKGLLPPEDLEKSIGN